MQKFFKQTLSRETAGNSAERVCFAVVGVEHQNRAINIRGSQESYDFSWYRQGEFFLFKFYLGKT